VKDETPIAADPCPLARHESVNDRKGVDDGHHSALAHRTVRAKPSAGLGWYGIAAVACPKRSRSERLF